VAGTAGQVGLDVLGAVRILEDDQPVAERLAPAQRVAHRGQGAVGVTGLREAERAGQADQRGPGRGALLGRDPPHQVVRLGVAVHVFGRQLGPAGAAEGLVGAGQQHHRAVRQRRTQPGEEILATHESSVARRETAPDRHTTLLGSVMQMLVTTITVRGIGATVEEGMLCPTSS
jgi:hypothetical protein